MIRERGGLLLAPEQAVVGIPNELLRRRPDIRAVERQVAVQSARIGIAQAELYPHFGISGEIGVNSSSFAICSLVAVNSCASFQAFDGTSSITVDSFAASK